MVVDYSRIINSNEFICNKKIAEELLNKTEKVKIKIKSIKQNVNTTKKEKHIEKTENNF